MLATILKTAKPNYSYTYNGTAQDTGNRTSFTFNSVNIGQPGGSRVVVVLIYAQRGLSDGGVSSVTIAGVTASSARAQGTADTLGISIYYARVPSEATTGSISISFGAGKNNCTIGVYSLYNLSSATPSGTGSDTGGGTLSLDFGAGGGIAIAAVGSNDNITTTWSGLTENYDFTVESGLRSGASLQQPPSAGAFTASATTSTNTSGNMKVARWR